MHDTVDVAIIEVDALLVPAAGAVFRPPIVAENVYTLGYPQVPQVREAVPVMQAGTVTNPDVICVREEAVFLFSAIARPGNSGGPILSAAGYVAGVVTQDLITDNSTRTFSPHYAGIPAPTVCSCIRDLDLPVKLPFEDWND